MNLRRSIAVRFAGTFSGCALVAIAGASAAQPSVEPARVAPTTITPGRPQMTTITVPGRTPVPADLKQVTITVGMQKAQVQHVQGRIVTFQPPAFANGLGERDVAVFDAKGTELGRGRIQYRFDDDGWPSYMWLLFILAALPMALLCYDIVQAYKSGETKRQTIASLSTQGLPPDTLRLVITELGQAPPGMPGLARTMMAFMLMLIVAGAIFYVLSSGIHDVPPIIDKTLTVVTTALTTVIAFYFGARTANTSASAASSQAVTQSAPTQVPAPVASIRAFAPPAGPAGTVVSIAGRGFGTAPGSVSFGTVQASPTLWTDALITVPVPPGLVPGQGVAIQVVPQGTANPVVSTALFTP